MEMVRVVLWGFVGAMVVVAVVVDRVCGGVTGKVLVCAVD